MIQLKPTPPSGFTLVEILVLLVIMGLAAMLILPSFTSGLQGLELEAACRDLATHMKRARFEAIGRHTVRRIIVTRDDTGAGFYILANEFGEQIGSVDLPDGIVPETVNDTPLPGGSTSTLTAAARAAPSAWSTGRKSASTSAPTPSPAWPR